MGRKESNQTNKTNVKNWNIYVEPSSHFFYFNQINSILRVVGWYIFIFIQIIIENSVSK